MLKLEITDEVQRWRASKEKGKKFARAGADWIFLACLGRNFRVTLKWPWSKNSRSRSESMLM